MPPHSVIIHINFSGQRVKNEIANSNDGINLIGQLGNHRIEVCTVRDIIR